MSVDILELETRLSELLDRVEQGEKILITKAGRPWASLVPIRPVGERIAGMFRDRISGDPLGSVGADDGRWG